MADYGKMVGGVGERLKLMLPGMLAGGAIGAGGGGYLGGESGGMFSPDHTAQGALAGGALGALLGAVPGSLRIKGIEAGLKDGTISKARELGQALAGVVEKQNDKEKLLAYLNAQKLHGSDALMHPLEAHGYRRSFNRAERDLRKLNLEGGYLRSRIPREPGVVSAVKDTLGKKWYE